MMWMLSASSARRWSSLSMVTVRGTAAVDIIGVRQLNRVTRVAVSIATKTQKPGRSSPGFDRQRVVGLLRMVITQTARPSTAGTMEVLLQQHAHGTADWRNNTSSLILLAAGAECQTLAMPGGWWVGSVPLSRRLSKDPKNRRGSPGGRATQRWVAAGLRQPQAGYMERKEPRSRASSSVWGADA